MVRHEWTPIKRAAFIGALAIVMGTLFVTSYNRSKDRVDLVQTNWDDNVGNTTTTLDTSFGRYLSFAVDPSGSSFVVGGFDTNKSDLQLLDGSISF